MNHHISHFKKTFLLGCLAVLLAGASSDGSCGGTEVDDEPEPSTPTPIPTTGCNAETCEGCCYEGQCYAGKSFNACGKGVTCELCTGVKSCSEAQKCEYVETAKWKVRPVEASIVPQDPEDNSAWDLDGSEPDVVVELRCPQLSSSSPSVVRTGEVSSLTPKWTGGGECRVEIGALLSAVTEINIIDIDNIFDDPIGTISHQFTQVELEQGTVMLSLPGRVNSLSLQMTRIP